MAKIVIEFDTITKVCVATNDGVEVLNFCGAEVCERYQESGESPKFNLEMKQAAADDASKIYTMTYTRASAEPVATEAFNAAAFSTALASAFAKLRRPL